jgi:hypothetical protein
MDPPTLTAFDGTRWYYLDVTSSADANIRPNLKHHFPGPGPLPTLAFEQEDSQGVVQSAHCPVCLANNLWIKNYIPGQVLQPLTYLSMTHLDWTTWTVYHRSLNYWLICSGCADKTSGDITYRDKTSSGTKHPEGQNVRQTKRPWGQNIWRHNICGTKRPWGHPEGQNGYPDT